METLTPRTPNKTCVSRPATKCAVTTRQIRNTAAIGQNRARGSKMRPMRKACQRLVTTMRMTMVARTILGSMKLTRMAIDTMGRPIPVTPLTMPPTIKARVRARNWVSSRPSMSQAFTQKEKPE